MTFLQKTKRYFEPIHQIPRHLAWNIFEWIAMAAYYIFSFEIIRHIFQALVVKDMTLFNHLLVWYGIISGVLIISRFTLYKIGWTPIMYDGMKYYYRRYLNQFVQADGNVVERIGSGRFITIIDRWVHDWLDGIFYITLLGTTNLLVCIYAIYFVFRIHIGLGFLILWISILSAIVATIANVWMRWKRFLRQNAHKEGTHQTVVALMSKNELLQSGWLKNILEKIDGYFEKSKEYQYPVNIGFLVIEEFPRFIFLCLRITIYIFIANKIVYSSEMTIADFGIFITIITFMEKSLNEIFHMSRNILRTFSSLEILWSTFDSLTPIKWYDSWKSFKTKKGNIEIKNISYGYNETNVFEDFSLSIEKWKKTALVGVSGGGKTTLIKLIAGYLHPDAWTISIMGNPLDETALKTYYPHIGYLTQDPGVFDATIRENLVSAITERWNEAKTWTSGDADAQLIAALKLAQCDFVFELKKWLDTEIWERWVRLSGGQKQRLAIAKIFLKNPGIILLDEPTSALDSFSEEKITEALNTLFEGRTVIIVAHRLQTVKKADDIIVIEWGKVVERGTHDSLSDSNGIYAKMLELQSGF